MGATISRDALAAENPVADLFGRLLLIPRPGKIRKGSPISGRSSATSIPTRRSATPAVDSNPVDVLFNRWRFVVADAGGNAIDVVRPWGRVSNLAVFPNRLVPNRSAVPMFRCRPFPRRSSWGPIGGTTSANCRLSLPGRRRQGLPRESAHWAVSGVAGIHEHHGSRFWEARRAVRARDRPRWPAGRSTRRRALRAVAEWVQAADRRPARDAQHARRHRRRQERDLCDHQLGVAGRREVVRIGRVEPDCGQPGSATSSAARTASS